MSEYTLKDKHVIWKDGFQTTCPITPALAIPRLNQDNSKSDRGNIPFDKIRFPCSLTCMLLETGNHEKSDGIFHKRIRTTCIPNAEWHELIPEVIETIVPEEITIPEDQRDGSKPIKETIHLKPK